MSPSQLSMLPECVDWRISHKKKFPKSSAYVFPSAVSLAWRHIWHGKLLTDDLPVRIHELDLVVSLWGEYWMNSAR